jgi:hypothetical protein
MSNPLEPPTGDGSGRRQTASGGESIPRVLEYFPEQAGNRSSSTASIFIYSLIAALFVAFIEPKWSIPAAALVAVFIWFSARRQRQQPGATLSVEDYHLVVVDTAGQELLHVPLDELHEVTLDTKTVQPVQQGVTTGGIPDIRAVHTSVGPGIDNSRIELVTANEVIRLTDHYTSSIDATDWFSKIRRFLRKNGWTPLDERGK